LDNIKIEVGVIGWSGMNSIYLAEDRDQWKALVHTVMNLRLHNILRSFLSSCTIGGTSRRAQLHGISLPKLLRYSSLLILSFSVDLEKDMVIYISINLFIPSKIAWRGN
jgi:hypothetical protein